MTEASTDRHRGRAVETVWGILEAMTPAEAQAGSTGSPAPTIVACSNCGKKNRVPAAAVGWPRCSTCRRPLPWVVAADDSTFTEVAERATLPVLVDLWAPWCGPCRAVSPVLESLARELAGKIKLVKVNVDESPAVAQRFEARGIPMLLVLRDGEKVAEHVGAAGEPVLRPWVEQAISSAPPRRK